MTNWTLADEYYRKARIRRKALDVLRQEGGHDDVVRESQAVVELLLKGLLRLIGYRPSEMA
jgi:HEPN domain-containing protein